MKSDGCKYHQSNIKENKISIADFFYERFMKLRMLKCKLTLKEFRVVKFKEKYVECLITSLNFNYDVRPTRQYAFFNFQFNVNKVQNVGINIYVICFTTSVTRRAIYG